MNITERRRPPMVLDPRCALLAAKTDRYNALAARASEQLLARLLEEDDRGYSLCLTDYKFLSALGAADDEAISITELARHLHLHASSATRRVRHLLSCGLITKTQDESDDRRYFVALTPEGAALLERLDREFLSLTRRIYLSVTDEELQTVYAFMDKCIANLASIAGEKE